MVLIYLVLNDVHVTMRQWSNLTDFEIQLMQSNDDWSLKKRQLRSLTALVIEELEEWWGINWCRDTCRRCRRTPSTFPASWTPMKAFLSFADTTTRTQSLMTQKEFTGKHGHFSLEVICMRITRCLCATIVCSFLFFRLKLTMVGMKTGCSDAISRNDSKCYKSVQNE